MALEEVEESSRNFAEARPKFCCDVVRAVYRELFSQFRRVLRRSRFHPSE